MVVRVLVMIKVRQQAGWIRKSEGIYHSSASDIRMTAHRKQIKDDLQIIPLSEEKVLIQSASSGTLVRYRDLAIRAYMRMAAFE